MKQTEIFIKIICYLIQLLRTMIIIMIIIIATVA